MMPIAPDFHETEAQLKADLDAARLQFHEAKRQFFHAKEQYERIGFGNPDGSLMVLRANQTYVDAIAAYRQALERWTELVLGRKPGLKLNTNADAAEPRASFGGVSGATE